MTDNERYEGYIDIIQAHMAKFVNDLMNEVTNALVHARDTNDIVSEEALERLCASMDLLREKYTK